MHQEQFNLSYMVSIFKCVPNILDKKDPDFASFNTACDNVYTDLKYLLQLILIIVLYVYHYVNYFILKKKHFCSFFENIYSAQVLSR